MVDEDKAEDKSRKGACGYDSYLIMKCELSHYTKMEQVPPHPNDQSNEDIDCDKKESSRAVELQSLRVNEESENIISRQASTIEQRHPYINTSSYCQRNDDTVTENANAHVPVSTPMSKEKIDI